MINRAKEKDGTPARVLLVGVGGYGRVYVQATRKLESDGLAVISAVVDPLAENSPEWPALAEAGVALFKTVEEFVQSENEADLAVISSPIAFHADQACAALKAGMNVLCEKPLCATVEDARRMVQASENSGGFMEIGYQWSFSRAIQDLKSDVMAGRLGAPERLKTWVSWPRGSNYYARNTWAGRIRDGKGRSVFDSPANNAAAHFLHNMFYVLGASRSSAAKPVSVTAECYRANPIENFDAACCRVETREGADVLFYTAHCVKKKMSPAFQFIFEDATVDYPDSGEIVARFKDGRQKSYGDPQQDRMRKLRHCIRRCQDPETDTVICGPRAAMSQTLCVNAMQATPTHEFDPTMVKVEDQGDGVKLTHVPGLEDAMKEGFERDLLFSEMNIPWARQARHIDLTAHL